MAALSQGADHAALAIADVPRSDDLLQERLIAALRKAGAYRTCVYGGQSSSPFGRLPKTSSPPTGRWA